MRLGRSRLTQSGRGWVWLFTLLCRLLCIGSRHYIKIFNSTSHFHHTSMVTAVLQWQAAVLATVSSRGASLHPRVRQAKRTLSWITRLSTHVVKLRGKKNSPPPCVAIHMHVHTLHKQDVTYWSLAYDWLDCILINEIIAVRFNCQKMVSV